MGRNPEPKSWASWDEFVADVSYTGHDRAIIWVDKDGRPVKEPAIVKRRREEKEVEDIAEAMMEENR